MPPARPAREAAAPLLGAALFGACELGAGLFAAPFVEWGRAEAMLFLAFRPSLLVLGAAMASAWSGRRRATFYAAALILAVSAETILLVSLGAADPWPEMLRGLAGGAAVALVADFAAQAARRWRRRLGPLLAAAVLTALLGAGAIRPYEALVLGPTAPREQAGPKPPLLLMTSLPLIWGEGGAFDPDSRPSESYRALEREFAIAPIDAIEAASLRGHRLMLLAQPRRLAAEELVTLDQWVRSGGRVLVLADPLLAAAREFSLMDAGRPVERGLLGPLLAHWGIALDERAERSTDTILLSAGRTRKLMLHAPGRLAVTRDSCRMMGRRWLAYCRIGLGMALVVADADILTDAAWVLPDTPRGYERHLRTADNPLIVASWLDRLAGVRRERTDRPVAWIAPPVHQFRVLAGSCVPILVALAMGLALLYRRQRPPTNLSTGPRTVNNTRTEEFGGP